ncbi:MAG: competence/damage-inducible protein A [Clostridia bacterium]|nr:competence/damage-inducible protein A [Clostridia bacterium]
MIAEILCVGTELLMGQVLNTNGQFLARELAALGVNLYHQTVVGDNPERLEAAYREALSRAEVVITSGGLGPTQDDITKRVAAKVAGEPLVLRPEAEAMVRDWFARAGREMTPNNLGQAMFTPRTQILPNRNGTAPGAIVPVGEDQFIVHLPGPPRELEPLFREQVAPWLAARSGRVLESRYVRIFGLGESMVDTLLEDLEQQAEPTVSPYCSTGEVVLRVTAGGATRQEALGKIEPAVAEIRHRLGDKVYAVCDTAEGSLAHSAVAALKAKGLTVATAESLTGGLIAATLVNVPGASDAVRGGFVTYQSVAKTLLLGVPAEMIEQYNVVSAQVAEAMATGARERLGVDIAVSATGLAGPGGGTEAIPVGTVFLGLATAAGTKVIPLHLTGDRERIRTLSMKHAIHAVLRAAEGSPEQEGKQP